MHNDDDDVIVVKLARSLLLQQLKNAFIFL